MSQPQKNSLDAKQVWSWLAVLFLVALTIIYAYSTLTKLEPLATICSFTGLGLTSIFALFQTFPVITQHLQKSWLFGVSLFLFLIFLSGNIALFLHLQFPTHPPASISTPFSVVAPATPTSTPSPVTSPLLHSVPCPTAIASAAIIKFYTSNGTVVCMSGLGTSQGTINNVVRVEVGQIYAGWTYTTLSTNKSHHSPADTSYNCPGGFAPYTGKSMARITGISLASSSQPCRQLSPLQV